MGKEVILVASHLAQQKRSSQSRVDAILGPVPACSAGSVCLVLTAKLPLWGPGSKKLLCSQHSALVADFFFFFSEK